MALISNVNINAEICGCDGNISLSTTGGFPPYSYSINSGLSFVNIPFFTNLCGGNYYVITRDVSGTTTTNFVVVPDSTGRITYSVYTNTIMSVLQNNANVLSRKYETSVLVYPPLPSNTTITFDLLHASTSTSSPNVNSSSATTSSQLTKNGTPISISVSGQTTASTLNTISGCQNQTIFSKITNDTWNNLVLGSGQTILITTYTSVYKNESINCYLGNNTETYSISNLSISGCSCCTTIVT